MSEEVPTNLYRHFDKDGVLLYVGVSLSAVGRLAQHRDHSGWFQNICVVKIESFSSRQEALVAERAAVVSEKPIHNVKLRRHEQDVTRHEMNGAARYSYEDLTHRVVNFQLTYSIKDAADVIGVNSRVVNELIDAGDLGFMVLPAYREGGSPRIRVTGWQLIDFIESRQAKNIKP